MAKVQRRESPSGFHFFNLFQNCPWKFFMKYPLGWRTFYTEPHLIEGGAFHEGKAVFYQKASMDAARRTAESYIKSLKADFQDKDQVQRSIYRVVPMLTQWIYDWGEWDLENLKILEVEKMHKVALPNGFYLTIRPDTVAQRKDDGKIYVHETKTTGFNAAVTNLGVYHGDQSTSYIWALSKVHPSWKIAGVIPDISFYPKNATDPGKIRNTRGDVVSRSPEQLDQFAKGTMNVISDISQRVRAVADGMDPHAAFPRNTQWCMSYNRQCEYANVCRRDDLDLRRVPGGFARDPWAEEHDVLGFKMEVKGGRSNRSKKAPVKVQAPKRSAPTSGPRPNMLWPRDARDAAAGSKPPKHIRTDHPGSVRHVSGDLLRRGRSSGKSSDGRKPAVHRQQDGHSRKGGVRRSSAGGAR